MIYKIKIRNKETGKEDFIIMGDSYKSFKDHLVNIVGYFNEKWHYDDSPEGRGKCLGQTLKIDFIELWKSDEMFVSFGGLKMAYEKNYDKEVEKHNKLGNYSACKYLKDISWTKDNDLLKELIKQRNIIKIEKTGEPIEDPRIKVAESKMDTTYAPSQSEKKRKSKMDIETIRDWLRNFAEDPENRAQMSANVYEKLWHMIQIIDHELEENKKEGKIKNHYKLDGEILQIELEDGKWCAIQLDESQLHHVKGCIEELNEKDKR